MLKVFFYYPRYMLVMVSPVRMSPAARSSRIYLLVGRLIHDLEMRHVICSGIVLIQCCDRPLKRSHKP
jgi:hypothetical protein